MRAFSAMKCAICFSSASLSRAKAVAVDDDAIVVAELPAKGGGHQVLQRLESFAAAPDEHAAILAFEVDARAFRRFFDRRRQRHAHRVDDVLDESGDLACVSDIGCVDAPTGVLPSASGVRPAPTFLSSRSAGGRPSEPPAGPIHQLVKYCWPIAQRLLTNQ